MLTGVSYMGHHNPRHLAADLAAMGSLGLDDVFFCLQENDFRHFTGKVHFSPKLARANGLRPLALFWGALNLFGGGRSSQYLLEHPDCFQIDLAGNPRAAGCYVNTKNVAYLQSLIDLCVEVGYAGYFVDEPTPIDCYCPACCAAYDTSTGGDLRQVAPQDQVQFRQQCVINYTTQIADYCKQHHPHIETICCLMPSEQALWAQTSAIATLDNIGTDIYWANNDREITEMRPLLNELHNHARAQGKRHHEWLHCWGVKAGREARIIAMGDEIIRAQPDALYVWAWEGQIGTTESCDDPQRAWAAAVEVLSRAKSPN